MSTELDKEIKQKIRKVNVEYYRKTIPGCLSLKDDMIFAMAETLNGIADVLNSTDTTS